MTATENWWPPPWYRPVGDCTRCAEPLMRVPPDDRLVGMVLTTPNCAGLAVGRASGDDRRASLPHTLDEATATV